MNWFQRLVSSFGGKRNIAGSDTWITVPTVSGVIANEDTALTLTSVFAAINVLSTSTALFDFNVIKRNGGGKTVDHDHPIQNLIHCSPNEDLTAFNFRQSLMSHVCTHGNGYGEIVRDTSNGDPLEIILLDPRKVTPRRTSGHRLYSQVEGCEPILPENMLHVAGYGYDGIIGYSPIRYAREAIGMGLASEKFGASLFGNAAIQKGVFKTIHKATDRAVADFREQLNREHQGPYNSNKPLVLPPGWEFTPTALPPEDCQFLETRRFQIEEIARLFNLPPHKLQALENAHYNNIEELNIDFYQSSLLPWLVKIENEFNKKLFTKEERRVWSVEHDMKTMLRANLGSRSEYFTKLFGNGVYSINEIRELEYLNPIPGGDRHYVPANMQAVTLDDVKPANQGDVKPVANQPADQGDVNVQATALNGAQIVSLLQVVSSVTTGTLPVEAAKGVILASFPSLSESVIASILEPLQGFVSAASQPPAVNAVREVVRDAVGRMVRREANGLRKAIKRAEYRDKVTAISDLYESHAEIVREAIRPAIAAYGAVRGISLDSDAIAERFVQTSNEAVSEVIRVSDDLSVDVEELVAKWEKIKAEEFLDSLDNDKGAK